MGSNRSPCGAVFTFLVAISFVQFSWTVAKAYGLNGSLLIGQQHLSQQYAKYTMDELINGQFEYKVSGDIDMDASKWGEFSFNLNFVGNTDQACRFSQYFHCHFHCNGNLVHNEILQDGEKVCLQ